MEGENRQESFSLAPIEKKNLYSLRACFSTANNIVLIILITKTCPTFTIERNSTQKSENLFINRIVST